MRILCVHVDPARLEQMRRTLLERQPEWQVRLEATTATAFDAVRDWKPDAVVTAMCPPDVDGFDLLARVRDEAPETIRVAIGGPSLSESSLRSLKVAHRVIPEDAGALDLVEALRRALLLRDLVSPQPLRQVLGELGSLPPVPRVYAELTRRLADPSVSVLELGELVSEDMTLSAQVLRMANSAYFGRDRAVTGLTDAAARLGTRLLRSLVLGAELYGGFPVPRQFVGEIEELQKHAALVARIASGLEPRATWNDDAFTGGLLHDIGKIVLASRMPDRWEAILRESRETGRPLDEIETERLGAHHGTIGACLLGMWGLPAVVLEAVHGHHGASLEVPQRLNPARAVALADRLAHDVTESEAMREKRPVLPLALITDPRWTWWREMAEQMAADNSLAA